MIVLRDMKESDAEDYVRRFTVCTDWMDTDAPWEPCGSSPEEERINAGSMSSAGQNNKITEA